MIKKKKQLLSRDEIKSFVLWMFVLEEYAPKGLVDSYDERIEAAGCHSALEYFDKSIDRLK